LLAFLKKHLIEKTQMKKKSKKNKRIADIQSTKNTDQNKNTAKLVLFIFGIGPILGIIIFLATKGFFNAP
tara:strand:- start:634 stop:843 length:210 start_codon:yes stop_codon:yes gene_type:complete